MDIKTRRRTLAAAMLTAGTLFGTALSAQTDDLFAFIPSGGRTLLDDAIKGGGATAELTALLTGKRSAAEWQSYLKGHSAAVPGLKVLDDKQRATLAFYLAYNMPLAAGSVPKDPAKADLKKLLPRDGRDLTLEYCQSCHIITVVITQDRTREAWLGTMHKPSHIEIKTTPTERDAIADYLVLNAGISIEDVPEDLRAGGASY